MKPSELAVFCFLFFVITLVGLYSTRWRSGDLRRLDEWGLAGRRFGGFVTWFLQGGSLYTTYAFVAVPGHVYGAGALGWFSIPYAILIYPIAYLTLPRLWRIAHDRGYVTVADYVRDRFDSRTIALLVAATGIVATLPYVALQVYGMEICVSELGIPVDASLIVAFTILAGITYVAGLRSAALIAVCKDALIWVTVLVAVIYIPIRLGGYHHIFAQVPRQKLVLPSSLYVDYATLALGSALALYLYPHALTGTFSSKSEDVIRKNCVTLPIYSVMLALLAMLGYFALVAGVLPSKSYGSNSAVPDLFQQMFPPAFAGFGLAAIAIGGLVPAGVMAIAAGNLFSRNVYKAFVRPAASPESQAQVSKLASLFIKVGAVLFILVVPTTYIVNFQLAGGVWILQTLPSVLLALFVRRLDRRAIVAGWAVGIALGTSLLADSSFEDTSRTFSLGGHSFGIYIGLLALAANLAVVLVGTAVAHMPRRETVGGLGH